MIDLADSRLKDLLLGSKIGLSFPWAPSRELWEYRCIFSPTLHFISSCSFEYQLQFNSPGR